MALDTSLSTVDLKAVDFGGLIYEDVMDQIFDISRIPLPFTDMIGTDRSTNTYTEWTQDELQAPDTTNSVEEGHTPDPTDNDTVLGARVGNYHQISYKVVRVSDRAQQTDNIGRASELAYQVKRNMTLH